MSASDVAVAVRQITPDQPAGPSLATDSAYIALHQVAAGTPERQIGDWVIAAQEPDWVKVRDQSLEMLQKSKDLRLGVYLTLSLLKLEGIPGLHDGLSVVRGLLEQYWETVHPRLDPEDDLDPQERINILMPLASPGTYGDTLAIEKRLREAPLCDSSFAKPSQRDIAIARGELKVTDVPGKPPMTLATVQAAFRDTPAENLNRIAAAVAGSSEQVKAISQLLSERVGEGRAPDLSRLSKTLTDISGLINQYGGIRQPASNGSGTGIDAGHSNGGAMTSTVTGAMTTAIAKAVPGEIRSKQDVQMAMRQICQYFERHEDSSPIPLLLKGAERLLPMNFIEIMSLLDSDTLKCLMRLSGTEDGK